MISEAIQYTSNPPFWFSPHASSYHLSDQPVSTVITGVDYLRYKANWKNRVMVISSWRHPISTKASEFLVGDMLYLRLGHVPSEVFSMTFALVRGGLMVDQCWPYHGYTKMLNGE